MREPPPWPVYKNSMRLDRPLNLGHSLMCGQAFRWCMLDDVTYRGIVNGAIVNLWQVGLRRLEWESGPREVGPEELHEYLRLDDDLDRIRRSIRDERVDAAFETYKGLRILRQEPWETLVSYVISQMSNVARICNTVEALAHAFGSRLGEGGGHAFPSPNQLAGCTLAQLRRLGLGYRAPHVLGIANAVSDGEVFLEPMRRRSYDRAKAELMGLPGVGPKVADCVLLFSLDHLDAFPVDRWVARAVCEWYHDGARMSEKAICAWGRDHFGRYSGYASQYLFHSRRTGGAACPAPGGAEGRPDRDDGMDEGPDASGLEPG